MFKFRFGGLAGSEIADREATGGKKRCRFGRQKDELNIGLLMVVVGVFEKKLRDVASCIFGIWC